MAEGFDIEAVRRHFPVTQRMLYFDSAHQSPMPAQVKAAIERFLSEAHETAGPKSRWLAAVEAVRERMARFLGAEPDEIAFTRNTSDGLNAAAQALPLAPGDEVVMIHGDHPNNAYAFLHLTVQGVAVRFVPMVGDRVTAASIEPHIGLATRAVSLSHVTFHAGQRFDVEGIGDLCARRGLHFVVDAMQSVGVMPLDVRTIQPTCLAFGCHKGLMVPQGLGVLYARAGMDDLKPAYLGMAGLIEPPHDLIARPDRLGLKRGARRFEFGNYNLPAIYALGAALDFIEEIGRDAITRHVLDLGDHLIGHLDALGIGLVGPRDRPARSHIYTLDLPPEEWVPYLSENDVRVSPERCGVRVSFGPFNTTGEIDQLALVLGKKLRSRATKKIELPVAV